MADHFDAGSGSDNDWEPTTITEVIDGVEVQINKPSSSDLLTLRQSYKALRTPVQLEQLKVKAVYRGKLTKELAVYLHTLLFSEYLPLLIGMMAYQQDKSLQQLIGSASSPTSTKATNPADEAHAILEELAAICPLVQDDDTTTIGNNNTVVKSLAAEDVVALLQANTVTTSEISDLLVMLEKEIYRTITLMSHAIGMNSDINTRLLKNYLYPCFYPLLCSKEFALRSNFHFSACVGAFIYFHRFRTGKSFQSTISLPMDPLLKAFTFNFEEDPKGSGAIVGQAAMVASYHFKEEDGSGNLLRRHWSYFAPLFVHKGTISTATLTNAFLSFLPKFECVRTEAQRAISIEILDELFSMVATAASPTASLCAASVLPRFIIILSGGSITAKSSKNLVDRNHSISLYRAHAGKLDLSSYAERCFTFATRAVGIRNQYVTTAASGDIKSSKASVTKSQAQDWGRAIAYLLTPDVNTPMWAHLRRFARVAETYMGTHTTKNSQQTTVIKFVTQIIKEVAFRAQIQVQLQRLERESTTTTVPVLGLTLPQAAYDSLVSLFINTAISANNLEMLVKLSYLSPSSARPRMEKLIADAIGGGEAADQGGDSSSQAQQVLPLMQLVAITCLREVANGITSCQINDEERVAIVTSLRSYFPWLRQQIAVYSGRLTEQSLLTLADTISFVPLSDFLPAPSCQIEFALEVAKATYNRVRDAPSEEGRGFKSFASTMSSLSQPALRAVGEYLITELSRHESFKSPVEVYYLPRVAALIEDGRYILDKYFPIVAAIAADPHSRAERVSMHTTVLALIILATRCGDYEGHRNAIMENETLIFDIIRNFGARYTSNTHHVESIEFGARVMRGLLHVVPVIPTLTDRLREDPLGGGSEEGSSGTPFHLFKESTVSKYVVQHSTPSDAHVACAMRLYKKMKDLFVYDVVKAAGVPCFTGGSDAESTTTHVDPTNIQQAEKAEDAVPSGFVVAAVLARQRRDTFVGASVPLDDNQEEPYTATVIRKYCVSALRQLAAVGAWLHTMKSGFSTTTTSEESLAALDATLSQQLAFSTDLLHSRSPITNAISNNKAPVITHNSMEVYGTLIEYNMAPIYNTPYVQRDEASQVPPHWSADMKLALLLTREILKDDPSFAYRGIDAVGTLLRGASKSRWEDDVEYDPRRKNYLGGTEPIISIMQVHIDAVRQNNAVEGDSLKAFTLYLDLLDDNDDDVSTTSTTIPSSYTSLSQESDMRGIAANQKLWGDAASAELLLLPTNLTSSSVATKSDKNISTASEAAVNVVPSDEQLTVQHADRMEILGPILSLLRRWCDRLMMPQCAESAMLVLGTVSAMLPQSVTSLFIALMIEEFSATCPTDFTDDSGAEGRKVEALLIMLGFRAKLHQKIPISPPEEAALWRFASREFKSQPRVQHAADTLMSSLATHHQPRPSSIQKANLAALYTLLQRDHIITQSDDGSSTAAGVVSEITTATAAQSVVMATSSLASKHIRRLVRRTACTLNLPGTMRLVARDLATLMGLLIHKEFGPSIQTSLMEVTLSMNIQAKVGTGSVTFQNNGRNGDAEEDNDGSNNATMEVPYGGNAHYSRFQALAPKGDFGANALTYNLFAHTTLSLVELLGNSTSTSLATPPPFAGVFRSAEECTEWFVALQRRFSVGDFKGKSDIVEFVKALIRCDTIIHRGEDTTAASTSILECLLEGIETYFTEWVGLVSGSSRSQVSVSDLPFTLLCDVLYLIHEQHEEEKLVAIHHLEGSDDAQKRELERSERVFTKFWDVGTKQLHGMIKVLCTNVTIPKDIFFSATPNGVLGHLTAMSKREASICAPILEQIGYLVRHGSGGNNNNSEVADNSAASSSALDVRVLQRYLHFWNSCLSDAPFPRPSLEASITQFLTVTLPVPVLSNLFSDPGIRHVTDHLATAFRGCTSCADQEATPFCATRPSSTALNPATTITGPATPHISLVCGQAPPITLVVRNYLANLMRHTLELQERAIADTAASVTLLSPLSPASDASGDTNTTYNGASIVDSVVMKQALLLTAFTASMLATARSVLTDQLESQVVPMIVQSMKWIPHHNARDAVECFNTMSGASRKLLSSYLPKDIVIAVLSDLCRRLLAEASEGSGSAGTTSDSTIVVKTPFSAEDDSIISIETEAMASSSAALSSHSNSKNRLMILFIESIQALLVHNVHRLGKFSTFEEVFNAISAVLGAGGQTAQHNHNNAAKNAIASLVRFSSDEQVSALVQPFIVALREGKRRALAVSTPSERTAASTRPERKAVHVISAVVLAYPEQMPNFCAKSLLALGPFTNHWHSEARNAAQFTFKNWWKTHRSRWDLEFKKTLSKDTVERLEEYFAGATYFV